MSSTPNKPWPSQRAAKAHRIGQWLLAAVLTVIWAVISTGVREADEAAECAAPSRQAVNPDCDKHPTQWSTKA